MKFSCSQPHLALALEVVFPAIPTKPAHPILGCFLLEAEAKTNTVTLTGFDMKLGIRCRCEAQVEHSGKLTIPAHLFAGLVSQLPDELLTLEVEEESLILTQPSGRYTFEIQSADEFPTLPKLEANTSLTVGAADLVKGLDTTIGAASNEETKLTLTGVRLTSENNTLELAATNGTLLAVAKLDNSQKSKGRKKPNLAITVPATALKDLKKLLGTVESEAVVEILSDPQQVLFTVKETQLLCRLLDGEYPAYSQLIPQSFEQSFNLSKKQLLQSVKRLLPFGNSTQPVIRFEVNKQQQQLNLRVLSTRASTGAESLPAQVEGEGLEIAFDARYLLASLKALPSSEVQFKVNSPNAPVVLTPIGAAMDCLVLVMPVFVKQSEAQLESPNTIESPPSANLEEMDLSEAEEEPGHEPALV